MALIPNIGIRGVYILLTPFDTKLIANVPYECVGVRTLSEMVAAGLDPKTLDSTPNSLDDSVFATDAAAGVCIVTLQAGSLSSVSVPSSYISGLPRMGGVPYTRLLLAADLGAIPDSVDLTYLKTKIADVIEENIGVTAVVNLVVASPMTIVADTDSATLEAARLAAITEVSTDYAKLLAAQAQVADLEEKNQALVDYIASLNLPPTP